MTSNISNAPVRPSISGVAYKNKSSSAARLGLSGDSDTSPLNITTTGVLVHTAVDYAYDEVFLWASNHDVSSNVLLTLEIGGDGTFSDPNKTIALEIDKQSGLTQIYPGIPHNSVSIYAKAASNNKINIFGYVDRHYRVSLSDESLGYSTGDGSD
jgi:hypothetical protein